MYECFRTLQPGVPLLALHGKHKQARRTFTFMNFLAKPAAVLFCTDVAARGLDFPAVDWVLQADAPEDAAMYIHRVGRTARNQKKGKSLLLALPSEEAGLMGLLEKARVPLPRRLAMNPNMRVSLAQKAAAVNASRPETRKLAAKAFVSYLRCLHLMPNKDVFAAGAVDRDRLAVSLGLATQPPLKFLAAAEGEDAEELREENRGKKNVNKKLELLKAKIKEEKQRKKRLREGDGPGTEGEGARAGPTEKEAKPRPGDGGLLVLKGRDSADSDDDDEPLPERRKKAKNAKLRVDVAGSAALRANTKLVFGDGGEATTVGGAGMDHGVELAAGGLPANLGSATASFQEEVRRRLAATAEVDRDESKEKLREKKNKRRWAENEGNASAPAPTLGSPSDGSDGEGSNDSDGSGSDGRLSSSDVEDDEDDENGTSGGESSSSERWGKSHGKRRKEAKAAVSVEETEAAVLRLLRGVK